MKPTPLIVTVQSTLRPNGRTITKEGTILIDLLNNEGGEHAGLIKLEGGSTGFESFYVTKDLSNLEAAAANGWMACSGTPGSWAECFVLVSEMQEVLNLFRSMQVIFSAEPEAVVNIYIGGHTQDYGTEGTTVLCVLLNFEDRWKAFTRVIEEPLEHPEAYLIATLHALDQLRWPMRVHLVVASTGFANAVAEPLMRGTNERLEQLWQKLNAELQRHPLEKATAAPEHLLVRACTRVAQKTLEPIEDGSITGPFFKPRARARELREGLESSAAMLNEVELSLGSSQFSNLMKLKSALATTHEGHTQLEQHHMI